MPRRTPGRDPGPGVFTRVAASVAFVACFGATMWGVRAVADRPAGADQAPTASLAAATGGERPRIGAGLYSPGLAVQHRCTAHWCLHWVDARPDAPAGHDTDGDGSPDTVEAALRRLESGAAGRPVHRVHVFVLRLGERHLDAWCAGTACAASSGFSARPSVFATRLAAQVRQARGTPAS